VVRCWGAVLFLVDAAGLAGLRTSSASLRMFASRLRAYGSVSESKVSSDTSQRCEKRNADCEQVSVLPCECVGACGAIDAGMGHGRQPALGGIAAR